MLQKNLFDVMENDQLAGDALANPGINQAAAIGEIQEGARSAPPVRDVLDTAAAGSKESPPTKEQLLKLVNKQLTALQSSTQYKYIEDSIDGCEALRGKKVLMVDDVQKVLESFVAPLMIATSGHASFLHHTRQSLDELVQAVLAANPEIVLMDYLLAEDIKGNHVVRAIVRENPTIMCIGFSSSEDAQAPFSDAGAHATALKSAFAPELCLQAVAQVIEEDPADLG